MQCEQDSLKMKKGTISHETRWLLEAEKGKAMDFLLQPQEGTQPC